MKQVYRFLLNKVLNFIHLPNCDFDTHFQDGAVYAFTNENVAGYLRELGDLRGGSVLSVAASGDQAFECYLAGARRVDLFDMNRNQAKIIELKSAMIKTLPYENFMEFFFGSRDAFSSKIIQPIYPSFSPGLREFLDRVRISRHSKKGIKSDSLNLADLKTISYINSPSEYARLGALLPARMPVRNINIDALKTVVSDTYDVMLFSNIFSYFLQMEPDCMRMILFYGEVLQPMSRFLTPGGRMAFNYLWGTGSHWDDFIADFSTQMIQRGGAWGCTISPEHEFFMRDVQSACANLRRDSVFCMRRRQR